MNRAMFSGVAGLKAHQTKMDVIGNNIANVNTYGFKAQRAVFSDIFYQTLRSASGGTTSRGGTNPSSVGYGSTLAAVQTQMTQSSMQSTGFGLDVAITGEGFFQVMDADGNIFYTKAGLLDYDSNGYLTDINGNFVLGATSADGTPGTQKIRLDNVGSVEATRPTAVETINGVEYTITASNATKYGNVGIAISSSTELPDGLPAVATISNSGAITVQLNAYQEFASLSELNAAINDAITEANGGQQHAAGVFTITADQNLFGTDAVNGTFTGTAASDPVKLELTDPEKFFLGALSLKGFSIDPLPAAGPGTMVMTRTDVNGVPTYTIRTTLDGKTYEGTVAANAANGATISLADTDPDSTGRIELTVENSNTLKEVFNTLDQDGASTATGGTGMDNSFSVTAPKYFFGGAQVTGVSPEFSGSGPATFTVSYDAGQNLYTVTAAIGGKSYTGTVSSINGGTCTLATADAADGTITLSVPSFETMKSNYGATTAASAADLMTQIQGSLGEQNYNFIPYSAAVSSPLTGAEIAGVDFGVASGAILDANGDPLADGFFDGALTFMKTSSDFAGSGQIGPNDVYATYKEADEAAGTPASWTITMNIGGRLYEAQVSEDTKASSLLLKSDEGDYIQVTNPGFDALTESFKRQNPGKEPDNTNNTLQGITGGNTYTVTPATPSRDLGFSSVTFNLTGGTEGGAVTLDQLSSIAIGSDGTISVSHPTQGAVVVGKISLATFANPSGLALEGSNYFSETANSGEPRLCDPGSDGTGALKSSALEMSNVDLSSEFADMITTQRGFQANSRIITVSDTMLEELINLKR